MNFKQLLIPIIGLTLLADAGSAMVQVKGSDTMVNLAQKMAEVYMKKNPGASVSVSGGGSGTGIAALINGKCSIANSSRSIKDSEVKKMKSKGGDPREVAIAIDALSIIVNPSMPIGDLSTEEVGAIYRGEITNWKDVGGPDKAITLYGRQPNSGTFDFLREHILEGEYSNKMNQMNGNSQIVEAVKQDASGIGYVGVGYVVNDGKTTDGIKLLSLSAKGSSIKYSPTNLQAVVNGKYPIARALFQYIDGAPKGETKAFIDFELSQEGQKLVSEEGFYSIQGKFAEGNKNISTVKARQF